MGTISFLTIWVLYLFFWRFVPFFLRFVPYFWKSSQRISPPPGWNPVAAPGYYQGCGSGSRLTADPNHTLEKEWIRIRVQKPGCGTKKNGSGSDLMIRIRIHVFQKRIRHQPKFPDLEPAKKYPDPAPTKIFGSGSDVLLNGFDLLSAGTLVNIWIQMQQIQSLQWTQPRKAKWNEKSKIYSSGQKREKRYIKVKTYFFLQNNSVTSFPIIYCVQTIGSVGVMAQMKTN